MVTIREATVADASCLPDVEYSAGQAFRSIPELAWIADDDVQTPETHISLMKKGVAWVAVDNSDAPIGFINGEPLDDYLHIWEMSVSQGCQGKGIGRSLMDKAKEHARSNGYKGLTLTTFRDVPWNDRFYTSAGFSLLQPQEVSSALTKLLEDEVKAGLPGDRRCAMRLAFK